MVLRLERASYAQERHSLLARARCASLAGALSVVGPVLAGSEPPDIANGTGDDPTQPLGKIELLDRHTEAPGPGVEERRTVSGTRSPRRVVRSPAISRPVQRKLDDDRFDLGWRAVLQDRLAPRQLLERQFAAGVI